MTFREKLEQEHPEYVTELYNGGCNGCPSDYGYEEKYNCSPLISCGRCWNREMPEQPKGQTSGLSDNLLRDPDFLLIREGA